MADRPTTTREPDPNVGHPAQNCPYDRADGDRALVLGVLLPGLIGDAGTWLWFGLTAMVVLRMWCGPHRRVDPDPAG